MTVAGYNQKIRVTLKGDSVTFLLLHKAGKFRGEALISYRHSFHEQVDMLILKFKIWIPPLMNCVNSNGHLLLMDGSNRQGAFEM